MKLTQMQKTQFNDGAANMALNPRSSILKCCENCVKMLLFKNCDFCHL